MSTVKREPKKGSRSAVSLNADCFRSALTRLTNAFGEARGATPNKINLVAGCSIVTGYRRHNGSYLCSFYINSSQHWSLHAQTATVCRGFVPIWMFCDDALCLAAILLGHVTHTAQRGSGDDRDQVSRTTVSTV
jgi:hypothetical protein